jgi:cell division protein FtsI/penicillin-binding protein 2
MTMMNFAAEGGESKHAVVPFYHVAGKTGTASVPATGGYAQGETIASFVGVAPYEQPRFAILVKIDAPQDSPWGSVVASPVFSSLSAKILRHLRIPPEGGWVEKKAASR